MLPDVAQLRISRWGVSWVPQVSPVNLPALKQRSCPPDVRDPGEERQSHEPGTVGAEGPPAGSRP